MNTKHDQVVSENKDYWWIKVIVSILIAGILIAAFCLAIVEASWLGCLALIIITGIAVACLTSFFPRIYTFNSQGISIADHQNQLIETIDISDIYGWNDVAINQNDNHVYALVLDTMRGGIVLSEGSYRNYEEMVAFFSNSEIPYNKYLGRNNPYQYARPWFFRRNNSKVERNIIFLATGICTAMLLVFGLIVSQKPESKDIMYLYSKVASIEVPRKGRPRITLTDYPDIDFQFDDVKSPITNTYFTNQNKAEFVNINKKIKVGILKSEYDWKFKNQWISKLAFLTDLDFEIKHYEILPDLAETTK